MVINMRPEYPVHQFAFFIKEGLSDTSITINDPILYHRIIRVLKCAIGDILLLFDTHKHAQAQLINCTKKECIFRVVTIENNIPLHPPITLGLPLLKGNDLDEAISFATQIGVSNIQLLFTERSQRACLSMAEKKRFMRVVIAAAEQSKRFCMPLIQEPISFCDLKERYPHDVFLFGIKNGMNVRTLMQYDFMNDPKSSFLFVVGPEADFSSCEYDQLKQWNAQGICLGATVLRSCTAAGIGVGFLRVLTY
jgi:16S rRNA (uracil1498-N3)-methyltransferase